LAKKSNFLIASVVGRGKSEEEVPAAGAAPAAGGTAPASKAEEKKPAAKK
jgi:hypothetical protein